MMFRINYELQDGTEDSFVLSADSIEEIREEAAKKLEQVGGINPWSEQLS